MQAVLSESGLALNASEYIRLYGNEALLKLQRRYTIRTIDRMTKVPRITKMFRTLRGPACKIMELPRFSMDALLATGVPSAARPLVAIDDQLPRPLPLPAIEYIGRSNPNQEIVVRHVVDRFRSNAVAGVTLSMKAGCGKSFVAKDIIGRMKLKTLIVVPNTYLLDQWVSLLRQYFPTATIGTLYGKHKCDGDIIVGIINTIAELESFSISERLPVPNVGRTLKRVRVQHVVRVDDLMRDVGLTIFDESHMYVSKEFRKVFRRVWSRYTLGLSATPDTREDKLDAIHQAWLGPILNAETLDGFDMVQDTFTAQARLMHYSAEAAHCRFNIRENGIIDYASIIEAMINDPERNQLIVDQTIQLMTGGLFTFVFSDRRAHLEHLYALMEERLRGSDAVLEMPEADKRVILYGGADEDTICAAKKISTVIFTTYSYSSTGVSITKMNGLVLATPRRSNMTQIIGRVFRLGSDASVQRIIVDIVDDKLPLKSQVRERVKAYRERGCEIRRMKHLAPGGGSQS